ncbi:MAG: ackA1 [Actinomycetia bacterium]|nr:ackA1 [Actinomycetes bacterium]
MRVLVVNAGSSSIKLSVLGDGDVVDAATDIQDWDGDPSDARVTAFLSDAGRVDAVGHRVVHGGTRFRGPAVIDDDVERAIRDLVQLAPLHQPRALWGIDAVRRRLPDIVAVACFDTAFHATMPPAARTYALPREWRERWPLQRFGFHGLSHAYAARRAAELGAGRRVVTCHLGAGASLCALLDGASVDTTMGFTPLEGLVMATRSGSIDPGIVTWLIRDAGVSISEVDDALTHRSGLMGLAGTADMREVLALRGRGDAGATLAFDVYIHRLAKEIAAMAGSLGGVDALIFTGGVGENSAAVRDAACDQVAFLGVPSARTFVVAAREDIEIVRQVRDLI